MRNQLVVVLATLALAACEREGEGVSSGAGVGVGSDKSNVTVLNPGAEPRTQLAYQIAPHSKESFAVTTAFTAS